MEFVEVGLALLNHIAEVGIVYIEILAGMLSYIVIVEKKMLIKLNGVFETV